MLISGSSMRIVGASDARSNRAARASTPQGRRRCGSVAHHAHLPPRHVSEKRLTDARRTCQQHVRQARTVVPGRLQGNLESRHDLVLADEVINRRWLRQSPFSLNVVPTLNIRRDGLIVPDRESPPPPGVSMALDRRPVRHYRRLPAGDFGRTDLAGLPAAFCFKPQLVRRGAIIGPQ